MKYQFFSLMGLKKQEKPRNTAGYKQINAILFYSILFYSILFYSTLFYSIHNVRNCHTVLWQCCTYVHVYTCSRVREGCYSWPPYGCQAKSRDCSATEASRDIYVLYSQLGERCTIGGSAHPCRTPRGIRSVNSTNEKCRLCHVIAHTITIVGFHPR